MSDDKRVALHTGLITVLTDIKRAALETMGIKTTDEVTNKQQLQANLKGIFWPKELEAAIRDARGVADREAAAAAREEEGNNTMLPAETINITPNEEEIEIE